MQESEKQNESLFGKLDYWIANFKMDLIKRQLNYGLCEFCLELNHTCDFDFQITGMISDQLHSTQSNYRYDLDDTKSYYQLIIKIVISEKKKNAQLWKKGKFALKYRQRRSKHSKATDENTKKTSART